MGHKTKHLHHHRTRKGERALDVGNSQCVAVAYYSPKDEVLTVEFIKGDGVYQYSDIGRGLVKRFKDAPGETLNDEII